MFDAWYRNYILGGQDAWRKALTAGIVGTGLIAVKKHIPAFLKNREQVELAAICDVNRETAAAVARRHGIPHAYGDLGEMLMREKLDFVNICTPPKTHAAVAMQVISHGSHVLIEKPMAVSLEECDEIIKASQENGVSVCVAHTDLFYPPFLKAKEMVDRGEIGEFLGMRIFISTPTGYMTSREDHWANRLRGGVIGETGPHIVYMTLAFMNHVVEVHAHGVKLLPYSWSPYEDYRVEFIGERTVCSAAIYSTPQWSAEVDLFGSKGILKMDLETMSLSEV